MLELTPNEIGCDEAGLGPLFGPVAAAAVLMPTEFSVEDKLVHKIKDSKRCSPNVREKLAKYIKETAIAYGVGVATVDEIDTINISNARFKAMHRALDEIGHKVDMGELEIVVDGDKFKAYKDVPYRCVVDADNILLNVAAASILAKTHRDGMVLEIVARYPEWDVNYKLSKNKGYGTREHMEGLELHGATGMHRKSFGPIKRIYKF